MVQNFCLFLFFLGVVRVSCECTGCSPYASCDEATDSCLCKEGFYGDGFNCKTCRIYSVSPADATDRSVCLCEEGTGIAPCYGINDQYELLDSWTILENKHATGYYGVSADTLGDISGDGVPDVLIGSALELSDRGDEVGGALITWMNSDGSIQEQKKLIPGYGGMPDDIVAEQASFGYAVACFTKLGGWPLCGIGAPYASSTVDGTSFPYTGAVVLVLFNSSSSISEALLLNKNDIVELGDDYFGVSISTMGDLDANGVGDLVVGAPGYQDTKVHQGAVVIVYISESGGLESYKIIHSSEAGLGLSSFSSFGYGVAGGDFNGDGLRDVAVGCPLCDTSVEDDDSGAIYVLLLGETQDVESFKRFDNSTSTLSFVHAGEKFGERLTRLDANSDSYDDVLVGARRRTVDGIEDVGYTVFLYFGEGGALSYTEILDVATIGGTPSESLLFGTGASAIGDINADGQEDVLVSTFRKEVYTVMLRYTYCCELCPDSTMKNGTANDPCRSCGDNAAPNEAQTSCSCNVGYIGDPFVSCVDVDECASEENMCVTGSTCVNTVGSYECFCDAGLYGVGEKLCTPCPDFKTSTYATSPSPFDCECLPSYGTAHCDEFPTEYVESASLLSSGTSLYGCDATSLGDVNGDGVNDILIGYPYESSTGYRRGAAVIAWLTPDGGILKSFKLTKGLNGFPTDVLPSSAQLGYTVVCFGDTDDNGFPNCAAGAPWYDYSSGTQTVSGVGAVFLLPLTSSSTVGGVQVLSKNVFPELLQFSHLGYGMTFLDDLDGDGGPELCVGAVGDTSYAESLLLVLHLDATGSFAAYTTIASAGLLGSTASEAVGFGYDLAVLSITAQEQAVLIVGYPSATVQGQTNAGSFCFLTLDASWTATNITVIGEAGGSILPEEQAYLGRRVSAIGDYDFNGYADFVVTAPAKDSMGFVDSGGVYMILLTSGFAIERVVDLIIDDQGWSEYNTTDYMYLGTGLGDVLDCDGDGDTDLVVSTFSNDVFLLKMEYYWCCDPCEQDTFKNTTSNSECEACAAHATAEPGSTACTCSVGFEEDETYKDSLFCLDIDECSLALHGCARNASCLNSGGSFSCLCDPGYGYDGIDCVGCPDGFYKPGLSNTECSACVAFASSNASYTGCTCDEGFIGDGEVACENTDECSVGSHDCSVFANVTCIDTVGSFLCECNTGFFADDALMGACLPCPANRTTFDIGSTNETSCVCKAGFYWEQCGETNGCCFSCTPSTFKPEIGDGHCIPCHESAHSDVVGSVTDEDCVCNEGYEGDGYVWCEDVDECVVNDVCGLNSSCTNTAGSFRCACNTGYAGDLEGLNCQDMNECDLMLHDCYDDAGCVNSPGSFSCACHQSYYGNGTACFSCPNNQTTVGEGALWPDECVCDAGFWNSSSCQSDGPCCISCPVNTYKSSIGDGDCTYCALNANSPEASTSETLCECISGYEGVGHEICYDVDECSRGSHSCEASADGGLCVNGQGSFACSCLQGYGGSGILCHQCVTNATSQFDTEALLQLADSGGGTKEVLCYCLQGYYGYGDLNCTRCPPFSHSPEASESIEDCVCDQGYQESDDNISCSNIDECGVGVHDCDANAVCVDAPGSFVCHCHDGFYGTDGTFCSMCAGNATSPAGSTVGSACECLTGFYGNASQLCQPCVSHATSAQGSSSISDCVCLDGYSGNVSISCLDIDECNSGWQNCSPNASCSNTDGSFLCGCNAGFFGDGVTCSRCHENAVSNSSSTLASDCVCNSGFAPCENGTLQDCCVGCVAGTFKNAPGDFSCEPCPAEATSPYGSTSASDCYCVPGYEETVVDGVMACEDLLECFTGSHDCHVNATCENTIGSFECACKGNHYGTGTYCTPCADNAHASSGSELAESCACNLGFDGVGSVNCSDVLECEHALHDCHPTATCVESVGSFSCLCGENYFGNGTSCHPCASNASSSMGSLEKTSCICDVGFSGNGWVQCDEQDECLSGIHGCDANATCTNTLGSYQCFCVSDFFGDGIECLPCAKNAASAAGSLMKESCQCTDGFVGTGWESCSDVDECDEQLACPSNSTCANTVGSYSCSCDIGFYHNDVLCEPCGVHASTTTTGSSNSSACVCETGYESESPADGCFDIDDCLSGHHNCHENATCTNVAGSFTCACLSLFSGNGTDCIDVQTEPPSILTPRSGDVVPQNFRVEFVLEEIAASGSLEIHFLANATEDPVGLRVLVLDSTVSDAGFHSVLIPPLSNITGSNVANVSPPIDLIHGVAYNVTLMYRDLSYNPPATDTVVDVVVDLYVISPLLLVPESQSILARDFVIRIKLSEPALSGTLKLEIVSAASPSIGTPASYYVVDSNTTVRTIVFNSSFEGVGTHEVTIGPLSVAAEISAIASVLPPVDLVHMGLYAFALHMSDSVGNEVADMAARDIVYDALTESPTIDVPVTGSVILNTSTVEFQLPEDPSEVQLSVWRDDSNAEFALLDDIASTAGSYSISISMLTAQYKISALENGEIYTIQVKYRDLPANDWASDDVPGLVFDVLECTVGSHDCSPTASCSNTIGSFSCTCQSGYYGDGVTCDACGPNSSSPFGSELETDCECDLGYSRDAICVDIDECVEGVHDCDAMFGYCENTAGSFACACLGGYFGDGRNCSACIPHATSAANTTVANGCVCDGGYVGDGVTSCVDEDECKTSPCATEATCVNSDGSFSCFCNEGSFGNGTMCEYCPSFSHSPYASTVASDCVCNVGYDGSGVYGCLNVDECVSSITYPLHNCSPYATCNDTSGSFVCTCMASYWGDGVNCTRCPDHSSAVPGSTVSSDCECVDGFEQSNNTTQLCKDVDECLSGVHVCGSHASCSNTFGSFSCACEPSYYGDGLQCAACTPNAASLSGSISSSNCTCLAGFSGDGISGCSDVDECLAGGHNCHANATCVNNSGSFQCDCSVSFFGNGTTCTSCPANATSPAGSLTSEACECFGGLFMDSSGSCVSCPASATSLQGAANVTDCFCLSGYDRGTSGTDYCVDVDECRVAVHDCDGGCENTDGSFRCYCLEGYYGNGTFCTACAPYATSVNGSVSPTECSCLAGYGGNGAVACVDEDECMLQTHDCALTDSVCENSDGSFECYCGPGFYGNGVMCTNCPNNSTSDVGAQDETNCYCLPGFSATNGYFCSDVDECEEDIDDCSEHAFCSNNVASFSCACLNGYEGNGTLCLQQPMISGINDTWCREDQLCAIPLTPFLSDTELSATLQLIKISVAIETAFTGSFASLPNTRSIMDTATFTLSPFSEFSSGLRIMGLSVSPPVQCDVDFVLMSSVNSVSTLDASVVASSESLFSTVQIHGIADEEAITLSGCGWARGTGSGGGDGSGSTEDQAYAVASCADGGDSNTISLSISEDDILVLRVSPLLTVDTDASEQIRELFVKHEPGISSSSYGFGLEPASLTIKSVPGTISEAVGAYYTVFATGSTGFLPQSQVDLCLSLPADCDIDFSLVVYSLSREANSDELRHVSGPSSRLDLAVAAVADTPAVELSTNGQGSWVMERMHGIRVTPLASQDTDASEVLRTLRLRGPIGVYASSDSFVLASSPAESVYTVVAKSKFVDQVRLVGLSVTPPIVSEPSFRLSAALQAAEEAEDVFLTNLTSSTWSKEVFVDIPTVPYEDGFVATLQAPDEVDLTVNVTCLIALLDCPSCADVSASWRVTHIASGGTGNIETDVTHYAIILTTQLELIFPALTLPLPGTLLIETRICRGDTSFCQDLVRSVLLVPCVTSTFVVSNSNGSVWRSTPTHLEATLGQSCSDPSAPISYTWSVRVSSSTEDLSKSDLTFIESLAAATSRVVSIEPMMMMVGQTYTFTSEVCLLGTEDCSVSEEMVVVERTPVIARIVGPNGTFPTGSTLILDGTSSIDPDGGNLEYRWDCEVASTTKEVGTRRMSPGLTHTKRSLTDFEATCFGASATNEQTLQLPPSSLHAGDSYVFFLTVSAEDGSAANASVQLDVFEGVGPVVWIQSIGATMLFPFPSTEKLELTAVIADSEVETTSFRWDLMDAGGNVLLLHSADVCTSLSSQSLVVCPNVLEPGTMYVFRVIATAEGVSATATQSVEVAPLPSSGSVTVSPEAGIAMETFFWVAASGFTAGEGSRVGSMQYRFGTQSETKASAVYLTDWVYSPKVLVQLPVFNSTPGAHVVSVFVEARSQAGALCASANAFPVNVQWNDAALSNDRFDYVENAVSTALAAADAQNSPDLILNAVSESLILLDLFSGVSQDQGERETSLRVSLLETLVEVVSSWDAFTSSMPYSSAVAYHGLKDRASACTRLALDQSGYRSVDLVYASLGLMSLYLREPPTFEAAYTVNGDASAYLLLLTDSATEDTSIGLEWLTEWLSNESSVAESDSKISENELLDVSEKVVEVSLQFGRTLVAADAPGETAKCSSSTAHPNKHAVAAQRVATTHVSSLGWQVDTCVMNVSVWLPQEVATEIAPISSGENGNKVSSFVTVVVGLDHLNTSGNAYDGTALVTSRQVVEFSVFSSPAEETPSSLSGLVDGIELIFSSRFEEDESMEEKLTGLVEVCAYWKPQGRRWSDSGCVSLPDPRPRNALVSWKTGFDYSLNSEVRGAWEVDPISFAGCNETYPETRTTDGTLLRSFENASPDSLCSLIDPTNGCYWNVTQQRFIGEECVWSGSERSCRCNHLSTFATIAQDPETYLPAPLPKPSTVSVTEVPLCSVVGSVFLFSSGVVWIFGLRKRRSQTERWRELLFSSLVGHTAAEGPGRTRPVHLWAFEIQKTTPCLPVAAARGTTQPANPNVQLTQESKALCDLLGLEYVRLLVALPIVEPAATSEPVASEDGPRSVKVATSASRRRAPATDSRAANRGPWFIGTALVLAQCAVQEMLDPQSLAEMIEDADDFFCGFTVKRLGQAHRLGKNASAAARGPSGLRPGSFGDDGGLTLDFRVFVEQLRVFLGTDYSAPGWKRRGLVWRLIFTQGAAGWWTLTRDLVTALRIPHSALRAACDEPVTEGSRLVAAATWGKERQFRVMLRQAALGGSSPSLAKAVAIPSSAGSGLLKQSDARTPAVPTNAGSRHDTTLTEHVAESTGDQRKQRVRPRRANSVQHRREVNVALARARILTDGLSTHREGVQPSTGGLVGSGGGAMPGEPEAGGSNIPDFSPVAVLSNSRHADETTSVRDVAGLLVEAACVQRAGGDVTRASCTDTPNAYLETQGSAFETIIRDSYDRDVDDADCLLELIADDVSEGVLPTSTAALRGVGIPTTKATKWEQELLPIRKNGMAAKFLDLLRPKRGSSRAISGLSRDEGAFVGDADTSNDAIFKKSERAVLQGESESAALNKCNGAEKAGEGTINVGNRFGGRPEGGASEHAARKGTTVTPFPAALHPPLSLTKKRPLSDSRSRLGKAVDDGDENGSPLDPIAANFMDYATCVEFPVHLLIRLLPDARVPLASLSIPSLKAKEKGELLSRIWATALAVAAIERSDRTWLVQRDPMLLTCTQLARTWLVSLNIDDAAVLSIARRQCVLWEDGAMANLRRLYPRFRTLYPSLLRCVMNFPLTVSTLLTGVWLRFRTLRGYRVAENRWVKRMISTATARSGSIRASSHAQASDALAAGDVSRIPSSAIQYGPGEASSEAGEVVRIASGVSLDIIVPSAEKPKSSSVAERHAWRMAERWQGKEAVRRVNASRNKDDHDLHQLCCCSVWRGCTEPFLIWADVGGWLAGSVLDCKRTMSHGMFVEDFVLGCAVSCICVAFHAVAYYWRAEWCCNDLKEYLCDTGGVECDLDGVTCGSVWQAYEGEFRCDVFPQPTASDRTAVIFLSALSGMLVSGVVAVFHSVSRRRLLERGRLARNQRRQAPNSPEQPPSAELMTDDIRFPYFIDANSRHQVLGLTPSRLHVICVGVGFLLCSGAAAVAIALPVLSMDKLSDTELEEATFTLFIGLLISLTAGQIHPYRFVVGMSWVANVVFCSDIELWDEVLEEDSYALLSLHKMVEDVESRNNSQRGGQDAQVFDPV